MNGGFEACSPADVATVPWGPDQVEGAVACVGWIARKGQPDLTGFVPFSETEGVLLAAGGHAGVLAIEYDDRDGALLVEQRFTPDRRVTALADAAQLTFSYRTLERFALGAHVTLSVPGGQDKIAPAGAPFLTFADDEWHVATLAFDLDAGDSLVALAIELPTGTRDATQIQIDDVHLKGVALQPATHG